MGEQADDVSLEKNSTVDSETNTSEQSALANCAQCPSEAGCRTLKLPYDPSDWINANFGRDAGWWDNIPSELRLPWEYANQAIEIGMSQLLLKLTLAS